MKKAIVSILVLMLGISLLAGCGGGSGGDDSALTGKYTIVSMVMDDEDILQAYAEMGMSTDDMYIELQSGGKFKMTMGEDNVQDGTFTVNGKNIKLSSGGEDLSGTIDGNKIVLDMDEDGFSATMTFQKK